MYTSDPKNARRHGDRNKAMIRASLEEVGPFRSIGVDGDGIVRAGNGVYEQARALGLKVREVEAASDELIAVKRADLRGDAAVKAALYDNRTGETAEWDAAVLAEYNGVFDLRGLFEDAELAVLLGPASDVLPAPPAQSSAEQWMVVVTCSSESVQQELFERLTEEGHICRLLIS